MSQPRDLYRVYDVDPAQAVRRESMGSKDKFWVRDENEIHWLLEYSRRLVTASAATRTSTADTTMYTGEHWAEKIASEIAEALGVPHAMVELARAQQSDAPGVKVRDLMARSHGVLVHGNELLVELDPSYPKVKGYYHTSEHTLDNVFSVLSGPAVVAPSGLEWEPALRVPVDLFVGYLLLDALIGNTDRHHENWALVSLADGRKELAPSYDHASSMGRDLSDPQREQRLNAQDDRTTVATYARKARSALYHNTQDRRPMRTLEAFAAAAARRPDAAHAWRSRLHDVPDDVLGTIVTRVPDQIMSETAQRFVVRFLQYTRRQILDLDLGR